VVGLSLDAMGNPRAFYWENGVMSDFNTLVQANSPLYLLGAETINSSGEIAGFGVTSCGDIPEGVGKKFFLQRGMRGR
jgi:probable HAF family extracellular repeat protein